MSFSKRLLSGDAPALVPGENFKVVTYTGNGGTQAITGVGFKPDWVWCKRRNEGADHNLSDSTRGVMTGLNINSNAQEGDQDPLGVTVFGDDGFTVSDNDGGGAGVNGTSDTYVAWCWKAAGGTTSSNTDGSTTSTVQANKAAGFSIVTYTGTGSNASVGHGLGAPAKFIMIKKRSASSDWAAFTAIDNTKYLEPNGTPPFRTANVWQNTDPTSSVFTLTTGGDTNGGSATFVAYCFADVEGYQKFGSYDGNGSTNGPIVNVGFEPAFVMVKNLDSTEQWLILDNKRNTANPRNNLLQMNLSNAESTEAGAAMNFYSNGFQSVGTGGGGGSGQINSNGDKYLYWAIAADPDTDAPTVASSFNIETYTGTGAARSITGLGFKPGLVWTKDRGNAEQHQLHDIVRGPTHALASNLANAQATRTGGLTSFDNDGFSLGADGGGVINDSSRGPYIAWTWKADDNEPTINSNGTGIDSFTSVNDAAGFSIVQYTGTGNASHTVGHGLSSTPKLLIHKSLDNGQGWAIVHDSLSSGYNIGFNGNAQTNSMGNDGSITKGDVGATTFGFTAGASTVNGANLDGNRYIAYCFNDVTGYQKIGSYNGSGSNGNSITTGFKPDFVLVKRSNSSGGWLIFDTKRSNSNPVNDRIEANNDQAEQTNSGDKHITITATAFEANGSDSELNASGGTYIYWAIAKNVPSNTTLANSFKTVTYSGNGSTQSITGVGFKPDLVWIKTRNAVGQNSLFDSVRGSLNRLNSATTAAASDVASTLISFDTDGFTFGNESGNNNNETNVAWCWKAGNTWQSNIDGTQGCLVNANTANGFSIVKWTTNGSSSQTVGHGLSSTPELVIYKRLDSGQDWFVETNAIDGSYDYANLNTDAAFTLNESAAWSTRATSTTITNFTSNNNFEYVAYCWHSVTGYSKIGTYTGTGSSGNAQNIGFQPDFVMIKAADFQYNWNIYDGQRPSDSLTGKNMLIANANDTEYTSSAVDIDFTSTGFSFPNGYDGTNKSNQKFIYMAFKAN